MKKTITIILLLILIINMLMPGKISHAAVANVFLNGDVSSSGDGTSPSTAVKTFEEAKALLAPGGTIWISGQVTISSDETWDLNAFGVDGGIGVIKRWDGISVPFTEIEDKTSYQNTLIYVKEKKTLNLNNLIIDGNKDNVTGSNSGNLIRTLGDINIDGCTFQNAKATVSGTVISSRIGSATSYRPTIIIKNSNVIGNEGIAFGSSNGTIAYDKGNIIIDNTNFSENSNAISGIICSAYKSGITDRTCKITNSTFDNNSGDRVIAVDGYDKVTISNTTISNNKCGSNTVYLNSASTLTISDSSITKNTATNGGGIYMTNGAAVLNLDNVSIIENTATNRGGGIYLNNGTLNIKDSDIKSNSASSLGSGIFYGSGALNVQGKNNISKNINDDTKGDIYLPSGKNITVVGDLTESNIGVLTAVKPTITNMVNVALPGDGYVMDSNYYKQFFSDNDEYMTKNEVYNTTNNKVVLVKPYIVTFNYNGGKYNENTHETSKIYPARNLTADEYNEPIRYGYTFNGWKNDEGNIITDLTTQYINSNRNYTAVWTRNSYVVTFSASYGGTISDAETQTVQYGGTATGGVAATPISSEYEFVGWNYDYIAQDGTKKQGTVNDYTTVEVNGDIEFKAVFAKKPFVSVTSTGNGKVAISKTGGKTPVESYDIWEINTVSDPLPVKAVINYTQEDGYELKKITFEDLYGHIHEVDLSKTEAQEFPTGNNESLKNAIITYDKSNKKLSITGIETTLKYKFEYEKKDNSKITLTNQMYGNMANYNDYCKYTITGIINGASVTKEYELSSGESIDVEGFDTGTNYTIVQEEKSDYETKIDVTTTITKPNVENLTITGTFNEQGTVKVNYSSTKNIAPNTGILWQDSQIYVSIVIIAIVIICVIKKIDKKNKKNR